MDEITVTTPKQLAAAIQGAAMPTEHLASQYPVRITYDTCTYTFRQGITQARANEIEREIRRVFRSQRRARIPG